MAEMQSLLQQDIPVARQALVENYTNLQQVAEYCENNYVQAQDKTKALQETKAYTTQSLASVAYQINTLAQKVLKLLDQQASELSKMESSINHISQKVDMHKEKVARREIGAFTVGKTTPRIQKITPPANPGQREKYTRKPIVYTILDDTGHGVKEINNQPTRLGTLSRRHGHTTVPTSPTGPSQGTLGRSFKAPGPVQPPVVPVAYSSSVTNSPAADRPQTLSDTGRNRNSCGAGNIVMPVTVPMPPPPPPPPMAFEPDGNDLPDSPPPPPMVLSLPPPPPPPPQVSNEVCLPPPPPLMSDPLSSASSASGCQYHFMWQNPRYGHSAASSASLRCRHSTNSPTLLQSLVNGVSLSSPVSITDCPPPPPPPDFMLDLDELSPPPPPPIDYLDEPPWIPDNYIEKVVALYAYNKSNDDELTFQQGEVIYVITKNEDGWYEGVINGATGYFPGTYVQPTD